MDSAKFEKIYEAFEKAENTLYPTDDPEKDVRGLMKEAFKNGIGENISERTAHHLSIDFLHALTDYHEKDTVPLETTSYRNALAYVLGEQVM